MTPAQRREARIALAMLPIGAAVLVASILALAAVIALAVAAPFLGMPSLLLLEGWCAFAAAAALWNARGGIALMSAFDWRPLPLVLLSSGMIVAAWLALP